MSRSAWGAAAFALAALAASLAGMATYVLWLYVRQDGWPQRTAALAFAGVAYAVAAVGMAALGRLGGGDEEIDARRRLAAGPETGETRTARVEALRAVLLERPIGAATVVIALFLSATVGFALWARGDQSTSYWDLMALWALAVGLYVAPFVPWRRDWRRRASVWARARRQALLDASALLALALLLRVPLLERWPDILGGDEGLSGNVARSMVAHVGNPFSTIFAYGNLYHLALAAGVALLGPTATALRLPNALAGGLAVAVTYLAGRELFGRRVGLVASGLLAVSHMHVHMSRTAHGQAFDTLLAAGVVLGLARGIRLGSALWMALAGVGLGLAQYFYVGARVIDVIAVGFVVLLAVLDRDTLKRAWRGLAVAVGAAVVTAIPMVVWALRRPDDYLTRLNATGFVQTGALAERAAEDSSALGAFFGQAARALTVPIAYPAISFYDATIPMLDLAVGAMTVLGVAWALAHLRDWRYQLLLSGVAGGLLVLSLGNLVTVAAYRITVVMPFLVILAAVALVTLVSRGLGGLGMPTRRWEGVLAVIVAAIAGYNLGYTFLVHLPECRYIGDDAATAAVSETSRWITAHAPEAVVVTLTEPTINFGAYPNGEYFLGRKTRLIASEDPSVPLGGGEDDMVHVVPAGYDLAELERRVASSRRPVALVASTGRRGELEVLEGVFPGGERVAFSRCGGDTLAELYLLPPPSAD